MTEYVRTCLWRYISHRFANSDGSLSAIVLHPTVEEQMRQAVRQTSAGAVLMLNPATAQHIAGQIRSALQPYMGSGVPVVLLTSLELRLHLRKLTEIELGACRCCRIRSWCRPFGSTHSPRWRCDYVEIILRATPAPRRLPE